MNTLRKKFRFYNVHILSVELKNANQVIFMRYKKIDKLYLISFEFRRIGRESEPSLCQGE